MEISFNNYWLLCCKRFYSLYSYSFNDSQRFVMMFNNLKIYFKKIFPFIHKSGKDKVTSINPVTLSFNDKELNREFSEELSKNSVKVVRFSMLFGRSEERRVGKECRSR